MADQAPINISIEFEITQDMIESFARLSGDYNSMHMNVEVARKSRFRQTIVHGMLPFSFLSIIQQKFPNQSIIFRELTGHFNKPVYVGDVISLNITIRHKTDNLYNFQGQWSRKESGEILLLARGKLVAEEVEADSVAETVDDRRDSFLLAATTENQYTITELNDQHETLLFSVTAGLAEQLANSALTSFFDSDKELKLSPNLLATLLLSTMVGMRLPGKYATFTRFNIAFDHNLSLGQVYELHASLEKVSVGAEHINASCKICVEDDIYAAGNYEVVVNSPPKTMLTCDQIKQTAMGFGLRGKVALVTGSSRGIGESTVKFLAMHGVKTVVNYFRGKTDAENIVNDIIEAGGDAISLQCDLTDECQVTDMMQNIVDNYGGIDILVNNAVREVSPKSVIDLDWNDYLNEMEVSIKGMHSCCKAVIPMFKKTGYGKIINLSTIYVANPVSGQSRYITTKSAVEGYTKSLAIEMAPHNIQVNLVVPNMAETDLISVIPTLFRERLAEERVIKRHIQPIEVAQSILFLASSWSNAMTGQKIVLNLGEPPFA